MNRRQFIAAGTAAAAAGLSASASGIQPLPGVPTLSRPRLARLLPPADPADLPRLVPAETHVRAYTPIRTPSLTLHPLRCTDARLPDEASIDIERLHPTIPGLATLLWSACTRSVRSIPAGSTHAVPPDAPLTLRVTQRAGQSARTTHLHLDPAAPAQYLLAVPAAPDARVPHWRLTRVVEHASPHTMTLVGHPPARAACVLLAITLHPAQVFHGDTHGR